MTSGTLQEKIGDTIPIPYGRLGNRVMSPLFHGELVYTVGRWERLFISVL